MLMPYAAAVYAERITVAAAVILLVFTFLMLGA
jgi:hypothetical protein